MIREKFRKAMLRASVPAMSLMLAFSTPSAVLAAEPSAVNVDTAIRSIFDEDFYAASYPDVVAVYGDTEENLWLHFMQSGLNEGRALNEIFDVKAYRAANADLEAKFGDDWSAYVRHYVVFGINEIIAGQRSKAGMLFNPAEYAAAYRDVLIVYGNNWIGIMQHYIDYGKAEGRTIGVYTNQPTEAETAKTDIGQPPQNTAKGVIVTSSGRGHSSGGSSSGGSGSSGGSSGGSTGTEKPSNPGTEDPEQPGTDDPSKPGTDNPENPGTEDPGNKDPNDPGTENPDDPNKPGEEDPGKEDPSKPGTEDPSDPGKDDPNKPDPENPDKPKEHVHDWSRQDGTCAGEGECPGCPNADTHAEILIGNKCVICGKDGEKPSIATPSEPEKPEHTKESEHSKDDFGADGVCEKGCGLTLEEFQDACMEYGKDHEELLEGEFCDVCGAEGTKKLDNPDKPDPDNPKPDEPKGHPEGYEHVKDDFDSNGNCTTEGCTMTLEEFQANCNVDHTEILITEHCPKCGAEGKKIPVATPSEPEKPVGHPDGYEHTKDDFTDEGSCKTDGCGVTLEEFQAACTEHGENHGELPKGEFCDRCGAEGTKEAENPENPDNPKPVEPIDEVRKTILVPENGVVDIDLEAMLGAEENLAGVSDQTIVELTLNAGNGGDAEVTLSQSTMETLTKLNDLEATINVTLNTTDVKVVIPFEALEKAGVADGVAKAVTLAVAEVLEDDDVTIEIEEGVVDVAERTIVDVSLIVDGEEVAVNNLSIPITITVLAPEGAEAVRVYYVKDGEAVKLSGSNATVENGGVKFETSHLTRFIIMDAEAKPDHEHDWKEGNVYCTVCGRPCPNFDSHDEIYEEEFCEICGFAGTRHHYSDGVCTRCGALCPNARNHKEGVPCEICGHTKGHDWSKKDGFCKICHEACPETDNHENLLVGERCEICGIAGKASIASPSNPEKPVGHPDGYEHTKADFGEDGSCRTEGCEMTLLEFQEACTKHGENHEDLSEGEFCDNCGAEGTKPTEKPEPEKHPDGYKHTKDDFDGDGKCWLEGCSMTLDKFQRACSHAMITGDTCDICGATVEEICIDADEHKFLHEGQFCDVCGVEGILPHKFVNGECECGAIDENYVASSEGDKTDVITERISSSDVSLEETAKSEEQTEEAVNEELIIDEDVDDGASESGGDSSEKVDDEVKIDADQEQQEEVVEDVENSTDETEITESDGEIETDGEEAVEGGEEAADGEEESEDADEDIDQQAETESSESEQERTDITEGEGE